MSSYNPNIPSAGTRIDRTFQQISTNFQELNSQYGTSGDHIAFTASTNNGKHNKSTYPEQSAAPTTAANEVAVYSKQNATSSVSDLYVRREGSGSELQITASQLTASSGEGSTVDGLQIRVAQNQSYTGSGAAQTFTYATAFPTNTLAAVLVPQNSNTTMQVNAGSYSSTGFQVIAIANCSFSYIAIGY